ncbi:uncharacterized protein PAC_16512 [Phialocephala subalpina]|uniref:DUF7703 domain-containing protein n=1 Tax=Phialocephala subalpina TaxID=576137 RepID=A0A1L7XNH1_9HELO|nr:uncharacterized protein PAC_16512 [Phialocephala subalpina]
MSTLYTASTSAPAVAYFITACIGIALYNPMETLILMFATFKTYRGCYFWSLLTACISLIISVVGYITYFFEVTPNEFAQTTVTVTGWAIYIVAQSLVLWSRLHLVIQSRRILRAVFAMIIVDAVVLLIPTVVMAFGNDTKVVSPEFLRGYQIMEDIQLLTFSLQECIISGIYIWGTISLLKFTPEKRKRHLIIQLFAINVILVVMDCVVLAVQYTDHRIIQVGLKSMVYSFKIKLELAVLGRLVSFVKGPNDYGNQSLEGVISTPNSTPDSRPKLGLSANSDIAHG